MLKFEVHTIRFGDAWWVTELGETLDAWCAKHGYPLEVWDREKFEGPYPSVKFCFIDMLHRFIAGDSDWMAYVDADVYVHPNTPAPPLHQWRGIMTRGDALNPRKFRRWVRSKFGERAVPKIPLWWHNRNAGVWFIDRESAGTLLSVIAKPYHRGMQEQHHFNLWLIQAQQKGLLIAELPEQWNTWWKRKGTDCFHHIAGRHKRERWAHAQRLNVGETIRT